MFSFRQRSIKLLVALSLSSVGLFGVANVATPALAASSGINNTMNFQGRLLSNTGAVVADGNYNMEFKLYAGGDGKLANDAADGTVPAGSLLWTEDWLNHNGTGQGVVVKNGYFSVQLGSITSLPAGLDNATVWLSMTVASGGATSNTCTTFALCNTGSEPEMLPMKSLSAAPFALNADNANQVNSYVNNNFLDLAVPGTPTVATTTGSLTGTFYYVVTATNTAGETLQSTCSASVSPSSQGVTVSWAQVSGATGYKVYRNTSCSFTAGSLLDATVSGGQTTSITDNLATTTAGLPPTTVSGSTMTIQGWNSQTSNLLNLQNSSGANLTSVDATGNLIFGAVSGASGTTKVSVATAGAGTAGNSLTIQAATGGSGTGSVGGTLTLQGGAGGGTNGGGGGVTIDAGAVTGSGAAGSISIGTTNAGSITIGRTASTTSTTLNSGTGGIGLATGATATASTTSGAISVTTGNATGTTSNSGSITLNVGTATSTPGAINIGSANVPNTVQIGSTTLNAGTQVINIGNNNTSGGTTNVTIGTGTSATGGSTTLQAKGALTLQGGAASTINTTSANLTISTTTSGTLALTSAQSLNITGAGISTWDIGNNQLNIQTTSGGAIALGGNTSVASNKSFTANGAATFSDATSSASAFLVQSGSSTVLGVDTSANQVLFGQSGFAGKLVVYSGTSTNAVTITNSYTGGSYNLVLPNTAPSASKCLAQNSGNTALTWTTCGGGSGSANTITMVPEFAGAVFHASGSNNSGYMQSDYDGTNFHNYYQWSTTQTTAQNYDIIARYQIPSTATTSSATNFKVYIKSDVAAGTGITVDVHDNTTDCYTAGATSLIGTMPTTWTQQSFPAYTGTCNFAAGDMVTFDFNLSSTGPTLDWVYLGELSFQVTY